MKLFHHSLSKIINVYFGAFMTFYLKLNCKIILILIKNKKKKKSKNKIK